MAVTTILSDLGNVVVLFDHEYVTRAFVALCGKPEDEVRRCFRKSGALIRRYERGAVSTAEFRRTLCARLNLTKRELPPDDEFDAAWNTVGFVPNDPVVARWRALRKEGLTLTAVSNIDPLRERAVARMGLLDLFDHQVMSWSEKLRKPSEELMVRSLDRSGCSAEEALFVDDLDDNLRPATKIGINVHHYTSFDGLERHLETLGL
jgi:HAD superfamily hydrolase (TIGR01509 family)